VLAAEFGQDWWVKAVPPKVQKKANELKTAEQTDPWHGRRGSRELDYLILSQLWDIIKHQWKHFAPLFPDQAWVQTIITRDMNVSRRVLAHMNPLSADDVSNVENAFRKWVRQLQAVAPQLP
jgi:Swt1-like HEPN